MSQTTEACYREPTNGVYFTRTLPRTSEITVRQIGDPR